MQKTRWHKTGVIYKPSHIDEMTQSSHSTYTCNRKRQRALLQKANNLLCRINQPYPRHVTEVGLEHFVALYETITQEQIPGSRSAKTLWEKEMVCQFMIDSLADDVFHLSLDHITGYEIVEGNRKCISDLLDIFEVLIDYEENQKDSDAEVDENKNCLEILPTPIRETLLDLEENAFYLSKTVSKDARKTVKSECTQTTPVSLTSTTTSPNLPYKVWSDLLKQSKDRVLYNRKLQSEHKTGKNVKGKVEPVLRNIKKEEKPAVISLYSSSNKRNGKDSRPKPVIGTKLRRNSSSTTRQKSNLQRASSLSATHGKKVQRNESVSRRNQALGSSLREGKTGDFKATGYDINYMIKLLDDAEKIRSRRHEISKQIGQLEEEDKALRTVESILLKEINGRPQNSFQQSDFIEKSQCPKVCPF
ncbi:hypothetical protein KUTeg_019493 [Tegillarca granosa]|uniref:DUF5745 domain-containing protein n=1 Tax=Tegillarca granosa TaxID=220873 RepID=A0ABQ9ECR6_TEGGR|nr:hypothetical protein KUTeg_019493 [Tegillarca granosa]